MDTNTSNDEHVYKPTMTLYGIHSIYVTYTPYEYSYNTLLIVCVVYTFIH